MHPMSRLTLLLFLAVTLTQSSQPNQEPGPPVGSPAPDFEAKDQDGRTRSLSSLLGPNGTLLVFYRSADW
jgi:hypothetical protein